MLSILVRVVPARNNKTTDALEATGMWSARQLLLIGTGGRDPRIGDGCMGMRNVACA